MAHLADLLDQYVSHYTSLGGKFNKADPVSDAEVAEAERMLGATIPSSVLRLWQWSNGAGDIPEFGHRQPHFFRNFRHFSALIKSAEMAIAVRKSIMEDDFDEAERIRGQFGPRSSIVVADGFETLQLVVSLDDEDAGSVWVWTSYGYGCRRCFDSVDDFIRLQIGFYEVGAVSVDDGFHLVSTRDEDLKKLEIPQPWREAW